MLDFLDTPMCSMEKSSAHEIFRPEKETLFKSSGVLSVGVEIEIQLIDPKTLNLCACAEDILHATRGLDKVKPEFYLSSLEINTDKGLNIQDIEKDLSQTLKELKERTKNKNILFATTGSHPFSLYKDWFISPDERYQGLIQKTQWIGQRMCVFGMHVHLGMADGDTCIEFQNFFSFFLPHLLALSASSPFWQGVDTGLSASRPSAYESLPTASLSYPASNWHEFEMLYEALIRSGAIGSIKDLWWDMRPSPAFGTLEIRVCDGIATLSETLAITAFIHTLAHWFLDHKSTANSAVTPWIYRENKWRAMRYGLDATLIINESGETKDVKDSLNEWIKQLDPYLKKLNYEPYFDSLKSIINCGNSASRQKAVFAHTGSFEEVVNNNVSEFLSQSPLNLSNTHSNRLF